MPFSIARTSLAWAIPLLWIGSGCAPSPTYVDSTDTTGRTTHAPAPDTGTATAPPQDTATSDTAPDTADTGSATAPPQDTTTADTAPDTAPDTADTGSDTAPPQDTATGDTAPDTGTPGKPECKSDTDCQLIDNCCTCAAIPVGESSPCRTTCTFTRCTNLFGIKTPPPQVTCRAGTCVLDVTCGAGSQDPNCTNLIPACSQDTIPILDTDLCYTGTCLPASECRTVTSCDSCTPDTVCVAYASTQEVFGYACVPQPDSCTTADCACLKNVACYGGTCTDTVTGPRCAVTSK